MNIHPLVSEHLALVRKCYGEGITEDEAARMSELSKLRMEAFSEDLAKLVNYHRALFNNACCDPAQIELSIHCGEWAPYTAEDFNR